MAGHLPLLARDHLRGDRRPRGALRGRLLPLAPLLLTFLLGPPARAEEEPEARWLAGDCHCHARPADEDAHVSVTLDEVLSSARKQDVRWLILTPHLWRGRPDERPHIERLARWQREIAERNRSRGLEDPLLVPGIEETRHDPGHVGLSFFDIGACTGDPKGSLALPALDRGGLAVLNHPFGDYVFDMSWKPWTHPPARDREADEIGARAPAIECYNRMIALADALLARPRERRQCERAFAAIDRAGLEGRRIVGLGGSDNHNLFFHPTTWALVRGPLGERSLEEALLAGRVVCGEDAAASSFEASSDREPGWQPPGAVIKADREVRLRWRGTAEPFKDGRPLGAREGGLVDAIDPGSRHLYRIVVAGRSYANPVFVNLGARVSPIF